MSKKFTVRGAWIFAKAILKKQNDHEAEQKAMRKRLREMCPHAIVHYNADPCGGFDSSYDCEICGSSWKSHPHKK